MSLRILHVFDHSLPLHSGYSFRTLPILRDQHALGWQTVHLTTPKQGAGGASCEEVDGWLFNRASSAADCGLQQQMHPTAARLQQLVSSTLPERIAVTTSAAKAGRTWAIGVACCREMYRWGLTRYPLRPSI